MLSLVGTTTVVAEKRRLLLFLCFSFHFLADSGFCVRFCIFGLDAYHVSIQLARSIRRWAVSVCVCVCLRLLDVIKHRLIAEFARW